MTLRPKTSDSPSRHSPAESTVRGEHQAGSALARCLQFRLLPIGFLHKGHDVQRRQQQLAKPTLRSCRSNLLSHERHQYGRRLHFRELREIDRRGFARKREACFKHNCENLECIRLFCWRVKCQTKKNATPGLIIRDVRINRYIRPEITQFRTAGILRIIDKANLADNHPVEVYSRKMMLLYSTHAAVGSGASGLPAPMPSIPSVITGTSNRRDHRLSRSAGPGPGTYVRRSG